MDYRSSGVDIEAGYASAELMKQYVKCTLRPEVTEGIDGFSGVFPFAGIKNMKDPVLLSRTNGVGTKLEIAFLLNHHDTIGIGCVAMCVNDVACAGGEPLFFLNYITYGKNVPEKIMTIVSSVVEGHVQAGCALVGGETTEHPGLMPEGEYNLAGFSVDAHNRKDLTMSEKLKSGDILIGVALSGVCSNDLSLVRNIFEMDRENLTRFYPELDATLDEVLLTPTCIYVRALESVKEAGVRIHTCSHITGGGFYENVPHMLKNGVRAEIRRDSYEVPAILRLMTEKDEISEHVMYNTSNMSIGMIVAVDPADVGETVEAFRTTSEKSFVIGEYKVGEKGIDLC